METLSSDVSVEEKEEEGVGNGFRGILEDAGVEGRETTFFVVNLLEGVDNRGIFLGLGVCERGGSG